MAPSARRPGPADGPGSGQGGRPPALGNFRPFGNLLARGPGRPQRPDLGARGGWTWAPAAAGPGRPRRLDLGATRISGHQWPSKLIFRWPIFRPRCAREITDSNMFLVPHGCPGRPDEIGLGRQPFPLRTRLCVGGFVDLACRLGNFQSLIVAQL